MQSKVSLPGMHPFTSINYFSLRPTTHTTTSLVCYRAIWRISPKLRNSVVWLELDTADKIGCCDNVP